MSWIDGVIVAMARFWITVAVLTLTGTACTQVTFRGRSLDPPNPVPAVTLRDQHDEPFDISAQKGQVVLVFFGYTRCPDVCPLTLAKFRDVAKALGTNASRVRFVFVTVDPEVDTPSVLDRYVRLFSPTFVGLTGRQDDLKRVYRFFGATYQRVPAPDSALGYVMAHSVNTAVIDPQGRWRLNFDHEAPIADMVHDIQMLLR